MDVEVAEEVVDIDDLKNKIELKLFAWMLRADLSVSGCVSQSFFLFPASPLSPPAPATVGPAATLA